MLQYYRGKDGKLYVPIVSVNIVYTHHIVYNIASDYSHPICV